MVEGVGSRGVPVSKRRKGRGFLAAAILALQFGMLVFAPIADAREPRNGPIHFEAPGTRHPAHNYDDCAICIAMHLVALPGESAHVPNVRESQTDTTICYLPDYCSQSGLTVYPARAPPQPLQSL